MQYKTEEYTPDMGPIAWQDGFAAELDGLRIEEQLRCYAWTTIAPLANAPYTQVEGLCKERQAYAEDIEPVEPYSIIVKEGKIVGVTVQYAYVDSAGQVAYRQLHIMPYARYCYTSTGDNNGAGYKEHDWYKYLLCLPASHTLW